MFAVLYFFIIRPKFSRQKKEEKFLADIKTGDRVMAVTGHGAFAEQVCIEANKVTLIPENMDFITGC